MKNKILWICLLMVAVLLAGAGCKNPDATPQETTAETTETTPDFTVYDEEGKPHKLSDFFGKPIVLNFWASWCPPCKEEMPEFDEKYLELGDEVQFLMVNLTTGDYFEQAAQLIHQQGYQFPVFYDQTGGAAYRYMVESIPVTYFIGTNGKQVAHKVGMLSAEELEYYIGLIYSE